MRKRVTRPRGPSNPLMVDIIQHWALSELEYRSRFDKFCVFIFHFLAHTFPPYWISLLRPDRRGKKLDFEDDRVKVSRICPGNIESGEPGEWRIIWLGPNKRINPWINKNYFPCDFLFRSFVSVALCISRPISRSDHTHESRPHRDYVELDDDDVVGHRVKVKAQKKTNEDNFQPKIPFFYFAEKLLRVFDGRRQRGRRKNWISSVGRINCE